MRSSYWSICLYNHTLHICKQHRQGLGMASADVMRTWHPFLSRCSTSICVCRCLLTPNPLNPLSLTLYPQPSILNPQSFLNPQPSILSHSLCQSAQAEQNKWNACFPNTEVTSTCLPLVTISFCAHKIKLGASCCAQVASEMMWHIGIWWCDT